MTSPIFFDGTGRRRRLVGRLTALVIVMVLLGAGIFAATVVNVPTGSPLEFGRERVQPLPFRTHLARLRADVPSLRPARGGKAPERIAFYVPWDPDSIASLRRHYDALDWIIAGEAQINARSGHLVVHDDAPLRALLRGRFHRPHVLMMVQNAANGQWYSQVLTRLLADRHQSDAFTQALISAVSRQGWRGAVFDLEEMPPATVAAYERYLARAHMAFAKAGLTLAVTVPAADESWNLRHIARSADQVILMNYDEHWQGGPAGPIASQSWFAGQLAQAARQIPADKLIVAVGSYAYDWHDGATDPMTIEEAWLAARDSGAVPQFDPASGNSGFAYQDGASKHVIWMLDAVASWNQLALTRGVAGVALWRLGSEDPGFWDALDAFHSGRKPKLDTIAAPQGTDIEGKGELLHIGAAPTPGNRSIHFGPFGLIDAEHYVRLPTPYVVDRSGAADPKAIALTFDDGPDETYTPQILSELERAHVPATFFVIGENALEHPELLRREVRDGDEIGNHSYTHPNLAEVSPFGTELELNATQRLIEAYTGRSTRLFRAPYFGDAEPSTADELGPAMIAQQRGYTIVGLHVDPGDWRAPGVGTIIDQTVRQVQAASSGRSANVVLLHDSGGDRSQTVAALPVIIARLRACGYHFVSVSELASLRRDAAMPPVTGSDLLSVRADVALFLLLALAGYLIRWLFFFAIALGIARAVLLTSLALLDRSARRHAPGSGIQPPVSVIIPAYNEARVIVTSIARVLASDYPALELIIADDGSSDATSALVRAHYGDDPRVRLLTLANGGKASALNRALLHASGDIIIALDADTQFLPDTIARLVRWFADERIGAVAGNARVGNTVNLVTRWQAIEYVTAQNVERRALDALGAITVVPGAVGAWRRAALDAVGGYPEDTLAEDQDLTIAIQRQGWRVAYDVEAVALTEAPETFRALGKQRYRWSFGTLQCLFKHRAVIGNGHPAGLAWFGMPQAWLFQILFAALSPVIDLALLLSIVGTIIRVQQHGWAQTQSDVLRMGVYWTVFVLVDVVAGWIAYRLEPVRRPFPALRLIAQRFVYRQLMYGVVLRSINAALRGRAVGWGKLERSGNVTG